MKVRVKFSKTGNMKFVGHLDVMRYFQKVNRRAGIDIAYSGGFSPHQIMSFASPLGLGLTSEGEYLDMELNSSGTSAMMMERMNAVMAEGFEVTGFRKLPDTAKTAMSIVAAADYQMTLKEAYQTLLPDQWQLEQFFSQESICVTKKTKKSEKEMDIRPLIYGWRPAENGFWVRLASGSSDNLKPQLLLEALFRYWQAEFLPYAFAVHRLELYADIGTEEQPEFLPLGEMGEEIV